MNLLMPLLIIEALNAFGDRELSLVIVSYLVSLHYLPIYSVAILNGRAFMKSSYLSKVQLTQVN